MPKPLPVHEQFTQEQGDEIAQLWQQGWSQQKIADKFGTPRRTIMKLCKHLGLKRSIKEAAQASGIKSPLDRPEIVEKVRQLRQTHSLEEIVEIVGGSVTAVDRLCKKYGIKLDRELYAAIQGERMRGAWTEDKRMELSGSKYPELNDEGWLREHYVEKDISMGQIAKMIGAPLTSVAHHLRRHNIPIKPKEAVYSKLRLQTAKRVIKTTKWGVFKLQSEAEAQFVDSLSPDIDEAKYESRVLEYKGMQYSPDFEVDGELVEVKPKGYAARESVDRQAFIKQKLIADHNGVSIATWYKGHYYDIEDIGDIDKYFCLSWRLLFDDHSDCFEFLCGCGFRPLEWNYNKLLRGLWHQVLFRAEGEERLNANFPNSHVVDLIRHFNPHYWASTHKGYNTIEMAFQPGNRNILRQAVRDLWQQKTNVNIYGLVRIIAKRFKDFAMVSIFKPWVARYIYDELLPNGGTIVDPCMGWGGRLLGTLDGPYSYIGYDLNPNAVEAHRRIRTFIGARLDREPAFGLADASGIDWPNGDLLFTSPPYDDTEHYGGLDKQCDDTTPIYDNIMRFKGKIALNVPKRHRDKCIEIARKRGRGLIKEYRMRTSSFMGRRESTFEPILVFANG